MDHGDDVPMTDDGQHDEHASHLPLSNDEQRVLDLYDQLQQLRLEIAIINAQTSHQSCKEGFSVVLARHIFYISTSAPLPLSKILIRNLCLMVANVGNSTQ